MIKEASLEFVLRKIAETKDYLLEEIKHNYLMSEKYEKTCKYLNYVEKFLILVSAVTGCVSISAFASLVCVPVCIRNSAVGINICAITVGIKKYNSIIKKKKKYDKILALGKDKLNTVEGLISKALINSYISHDEFASINGIHHIKTMETYCVNSKKYNASKNSSARKIKQTRLTLSSNCALGGKKNLLLLKTKKFIVFQMISLK